MSLSIEGRTAIVTGAGRGIGLAVARHFVDRGANVMFADPDEDRLTAAVADLGGTEGPVRTFVADCGQKLGLANLLSATVDAFDRVDIVVNAQRLVLPVDPLDTDLDALDRMLQQNLIASLRLSQLAARRMIRQAEEDRAGGSDAIGAIVTLSTLAAQRPAPAHLGYAIAAAATEQATRSLALALAPHRIRVNGLRFGSVMSAELQALLKETAGLREQTLRGTPLGRIAGADELAETVLFLASPGAGFMTGQIVTVDGGRSLVDPVAAAIA